MRNTTLQSILKLYHSKDSSQQVSIVSWLWDDDIYGRGYAIQSTFYCVEKFKRDFRILHKEHKVGRIILN
jgi:hypothetical protein